jgi:hypothetical protein
VRRLIVGPDISRAYIGARLFELLGHYGELEFGFGQGLDDRGFGVLRGGVAGGGHFADEEILGALEHFLFAERERLAGAKRHETLEDHGNFEKSSGAHALGVFFEAMLPVVVRVEFALLEEAEDFAGFNGANNGAQTNGNGIRLRNHDAQTTRNNANHEVALGSAVQDAVADLFYNSNAVVRINDLVADLVVHARFSPWRYVGQCRRNVWKESRYIQWNEEVRKRSVPIWQWNCIGGVKIGSHEAFRRMARRAAAGPEFRFGERVR